MKTRILLVLLLIVGTVFLRGDGCITKTKTTDLIGYIEICEEYPEDEDAAQWNDPKDISFDVEVDKEIKDAGYNKEQVTDARFVVGHYGALNNESDHDWIIGGSITVQRVDILGEPLETAMVYQTQSVDAAIGKKIKADVLPKAVTVINDAVQAYLDDEVGVTLRFTLANQEAVGPGGEQVSPADPMVFEWKAWIELYIEVTEDVDWPDPF